jgi:hypothetical protein
MLGGSRKPIAPKSFSIEGFGVRRTTHRERTSSRYVSHLACFYLFSLLSVYLEERALSAPHGIQIETPPDWPFSLALIETYTRWTSQATRSLYVPSSSYPLTLSKDSIGVIFHTR